MFSSERARKRFAADRAMRAAQPNEVKIDPKVAVEQTLFIVDGYKRVLTYAELVEPIETGKLTAKEELAILAR